MQIRRDLASLKLQTAFRRFVAIKSYNLLRHGALTAQRLERGRKARSLFLVMKRNACCVRLQTWWRMMRLNITYRSLRRAIIAIQCKYRVILARRILRELKLEAKDLGNLQRDNAKLKAEIAGLQEAARMASQTKLVMEHQIATEAL